jgi:hypothetical protein
MKALLMFPVVTSALLLAPVTGMAGDSPIRVWLDEDTYARGETAQVKVKAAHDGYLMVIRATTEGRVRVLFPLDPSDDNFIRGGRTIELHGRGDREAFAVDDPGGTGTVYAALSPDPFNYTEFVRGDHWDYQALSSYRVTDDAEEQLTNLADRMAAGAHFSYDLVHYDVPSATAHDYRPYDSYVRYYEPSYSPWYDCWSCYSYGPGISVGISFGFPWYYPAYYPYWGYPSYGYPYYGYPYYGYPYQGHYGGYYGYPGGYPHYVGKPGLTPTTPYRPRGWSGGWVNTTPVGFRPRGTNGATGVTTPIMDRRPVGKVDARPRYNPLIGDSYRRTANPTAPDARRFPETRPQVDASQPRIREGGSAPDAPRVSSGGGGESRRTYGGTYSTPAPSKGSGGPSSSPRRGGGGSYSPPSKGGGGSYSAPKSGGGGGRGMSGGRSAPSSHGGSGGRRR